MIRPVEDTYQSPIHVKSQGVPVLMDLTEGDIVNVGELTPLALLAAWRYSLLEPLIRVHPG